MPWFWKRIELNVPYEAPELVYTAISGIGTARSSSLLDPRIAGKSPLAGFFTFKIRHSLLLVVHIPSIALVYLGRLLSADTAAYCRPHNLQIQRLGLAFEQPHVTFPLSAASSWKQIPPMKL